MNQMFKTGLVFMLALGADLPEESDQLDDSCFCQVNTPDCEGCQVATCRSCQNLTDQA